MKILRDYTLIEWNKYFDLSEKSLSGLFWKDNLGKNGDKGGIAGTKCYDCRSKQPSSWQVKLNGTHWLVHRIILVMNGFDISEKIIDHEDGNPFNNSLTNLKITTQKFNCQNTKMKVNNTSGVAGVSIKVNKEGRRYFGAYFTSNGKRKTKYFSIDDFGYDEAFKLACNYRSIMIEEMNANGSNYSKRHGIK